MLLLVGVAQAVAPMMASEGGESGMMRALWSNPVPSFLSVAGQSAATTVRGLVPVDPPRVLGVPGGATVANAPTSANGATGGAGVAKPGAPSGSGAVKPGGASGGATTSASGAGDGRALTAAAARAPAQSEAGIPIQVYLSRRPDSEADFTAVYPVKRMAGDRGVAAAALASLIEGPSASERAAGYFSELGRSLSGQSSCGGRDVQVSVADGVATVKFCRAVTSAGIGQDARTRAQIERTLGQFSTIRSVRILGATGHCLFDGSGQDRCLSVPPAVPKPGASTAGR